MDDCNKSPQEPGIKGSQVFIYWGSPTNNKVEIRWDLLPRGTVIHLWPPPKKQLASQSTRSIWDPAQKRLVPQRLLLAEWVPTKLVHHFFILYQLRKIKKEKHAVLFPKYMLYFFCSPSVLFLSHWKSSWQPVSNILGKYHKSTMRNFLMYSGSNIYIWLI